jgi:hypothetical protein
MQGRARVAGSESGAPPDCDAAFFVGNQHQHPSFFLVSESCCRRADRQQVALSGYGYVRDVVCGGGYVWVDKRAAARSFNSTPAA